MNNKIIIAVDFDGTCVTHEFPKVGRDVPGAVQVLKRLVANGHKLILWTMRSDSEDRKVLTDAAAWFAVRSIPLYGVNSNPSQYWSQSPKAYANLYIDDAALGCPLLPGEPGERDMVNWDAVEKWLEKEGLL